MTAREFKPGDVVSMYVASRRRRHRAVRVEDNLDGAVYQWRLLDGDDSSLDLIADRIVEDVRPLAVIDPENCEQVELFRSVLAKWGYNFQLTPGYYNPARDGSCIAAALREFANPTPPKPAEPTGLGAVVEAAAYSDEIRTFVRGPGSRSPWFDASGNGHEWNELDVARIVAEGVTP